VGDKIQPLDVTSLRWRCEPGALGFASTRDLEPLANLDGSRRWIEALQFGIAMRRPEYNIFAIGPEGIGKKYLTQHLVQQQAAQEPVPDEWCYVYNFDQPHIPNVLRLPHGRGSAFKSEIEQLVNDLKQVLVAAFEGEEYRTRHQLIEQELKEKQEQAFSDIEKEAQQHSIGLLRTPMGFTFAPMRDGSVMQPPVFQALSDAERREIEETINQLQGKLQEVLQQVPVWTKQTQDKVRKLNQETATYAVSGLIQQLQKTYGDVPEIPEHLDALKADMVANADGILAMAAQMAQAGGGEQAANNPLLRRYGVNLLVDNSELGHAPVITEDNPTYDRLIGRIEHRSEMGNLVTDFHLIRSGALHKANGGYLMLDARRLLSRPMAYDALKQALRSAKIEIEPLAQLYGLPSTITLQPESIPLNVKIVLLGDRTLYYRLNQADPEFGELFKVVADFDEEVERTDGVLADYVRVIAGLVASAEVRPVDAAAIARLCEHAARLASASEKLSLRTETLREVLIEADFWAGQSGRDQIELDDLQKALEKREFRSDRIRERVQEEIRKGTIRIETEGAAAGQINGLSVLQIGDFAFGQPSRITAQVRLGNGSVIDIEREAKLGGPLHSKGVMILSGYLGAKFGVDLPLSVSATLVFEQSYGGVDGDSASAAELIALLSAIGQVPLAQSFAMTGSVDQNGRVQAIGGVNHKIEGFFDVCAARGLTGQQGVLVPKTNVRHLMLADRVIEAVKAGQFQIYAVETVDDAIHILSDCEAGEAGTDGTFPPDSFYGKVAARLKVFAEARKKFGATTEGQQAAKQKEGE
jgi:lon-related putative ATP-dependent protease